MSEKQPQLEYEPLGGIEIPYTKWIHWVPGDGEVTYCGCEAVNKRPGSTPLAEGERFCPDCVRLKGGRP